MLVSAALRLQDFALSFSPYVFSSLIFFTLCFLIVFQIFYSVLDFWGESKG